MKVFAPAAFRYSGVDYPYGWQDIPDDTTARALLSASTVWHDESPPASGGGAVTTANITDAGAAGVAVLQSATQAAAQVAMGVPLQAPVALSISTTTNLDRATYGNRIIDLTITVNSVVSVVLPTDSWVAGDRITLRCISTAGSVSAAQITSSSGTLVPYYGPYLAAPGQVISIRRNPANTGWSTEQALPLQPSNSGTFPWMQASGGTVKATVTGTDFIWSAGSQMVQYTNNNTTNGATIENRCQGTLLTNDVTGTYALNSFARTTAEQVDISGNWAVGAEFRVVAHYKTAPIFSNGPAAITGKRHAAIASTGTRYSDSKHWGGLLFGSISGGLFNGAGFWLDEQMNFVQARGRATVSEQRDTGTASFTVADNTAQVVMAGSGTVTVTFPQTPVDGQDLPIFLETAYTAITLSGGALASTFVAGTIGVTAGSFGTWSYRAAGNIWRRKG